MALQFEYGVTNLLQTSFLYIMLGIRLGAVFSESLFCLFVKSWLKYNCIYKYSIQLEKVVIIEKATYLKEKFVGKHTLPTLRCWDCQQNCIVVNYYWYS